MTWRLDIIPPAQEPQCGLAILTSSPPRFFTNPIAVTVHPDGRRFGLLQAKASVIMTMNSSTQPRTREETSDARAKGSFEQRRQEQDITEQKTKPRDAYRKEKRQKDGSSKKETNRQRDAQGTNRKAAKSEVRPKRDALEVTSADTKTQEREGYKIRRNGGIP